MDDIQKRHIQNDTVSSVMIPQGYTAKLYFSDGTDFVLEGPMWTDSEQAMRCLDLQTPCVGIDLYQIGVYRNSQGLPAKGHWESYTSTESIDFTYHLGLSWSDST